MCRIREASFESMSERFFELKGDKFLRLFIFLPHFMYKNSQKNKKRVFWGVKKISDGYFSYFKKLLDTI